MKKERKYRGFWDDGHDSGEIKYYSTSRNYSKNNMEDMKKEYFKRHDYSKFGKITFQFGYLLED